MNTDFGLTPFEDTTEEAAHRLIVKHLQHASPAEQLCFALRSNYDGNAHALRWLADRPQTERAAILAMYWSLGADYFTQYATEADVPDYERPRWRFTRLLEARYTGGFYPNATVYFDPYDSDSACPFEYEDIERARAVPPEMLTAVNGDTHVDIDSDFDSYDDGLPSEVAEALWALYDDADNHAG